MKLDINFCQRLNLKFKIKNTAQPMTSTIQRVLAVIAFRCSNISCEFLEKVQNNKNKYNICKKKVLHVMPYSKRYGDKIRRSSTQKLKKRHEWFTLQSYGFSWCVLK